MSRRNDSSSVIAVFVVIVFLLFIGWILDASTPKCIKAGCKNDQARNSNYCYLHKPYTGHSSYKSKLSSSSKSTSGSTSTGNKGNSSGKTSSSTKSYGTSKKSSSYSSYDDGYDAIYDDGDYDDDRYWSDSDYAEGVDDALDELGW